MSPVHAFLFSLGQSHGIYSLQVSPQIVPVVFLWCSTSVLVHSGVCMGATTTRSSNPTSRASGEHAVTHTPGSPKPQLLKDSYARVQGCFTGAHAQKDARQ